MRLNKFLATATHLSRRKADEAIPAGLVTINGEPAEQGQAVGPTDVVALQGTVVQAPVSTTTIMFNKPAGVVVSRDGQGSDTIYDIMPAEYHHLNPIGRLDKYSSGLLLLTSDGTLAHELTHPSRQKVKVYQVFLDKPLQPLHRQMISDHGITLEDGVSKLELERETEADDIAWIVRMHEGRNRQIRRTFESLGYRVTHLRRTHFGEYTLGTLKPGATKIV